MTAPAETSTPEPSDPKQESRPKGDDIQSDRNVNEWVKFLTSRTFRKWSGLAMLLYTIVSDVLIAFALTTSEQVQDILAMTLGVNIVVLVLVIWTWKAEDIDLTAPTQDDYLQKVVATTAILLEILFADLAEGTVAVYHFVRCGFDFLFFLKILILLRGPFEFYNSSREFFVLQRLRLGDEKVERAKCMLLVLAIVCAAAAILIPVANLNELEKGEACDAF